MTYLIDTNILLRSADSLHYQYSIAIDAVGSLFSQNEQLCIMPQNLIEFWNVYTRPKDKNGLGGTITEAKAESNRIKSIFTLLAETEAIYFEWEKLVTNYQVKGVNVHDAKLVASMLVHGLTHILTFNTDDFRRYQVIQVIHPHDIVSSR